MNRYTIYIFSAFLIFAINGCSVNENLDSRKIEENPELSEKIFSTGDFETAETLRISYSEGKLERGISYNKETPLPLPDETIVSKGDLKPTWQFMEKRLGFTIVDMAKTAPKSGDMIKEGKLNGFKDAAIYGGTGIAADLMSYGTQGYFLNLKKYLEYMPHLTAYFDSNPNIAKAITASDGGIYHIPYVAEIDQYARILTGRPDWVTALLDGGTKLEEETVTLDVAYEGYWDRYDRNVVRLQNDSSDGGTLDQRSALTVLKKYISETYPHLDRPSDLYLGKTARYDIDELVGLWRVLSLSPRTLSKITTGAVQENAKIIPFFTRKSSYREDFLRFITFFDGERCHSFDSYNTARFYVDNEGVMHYSYGEEDFLTKVNYLEQWYTEGLIHHELTNLSNTGDFRKSLYFSDETTGQKEFGFMTLDWIATTTAASDKVAGMLPPMTTISDAGINQFIHFMENTRSIKPDGWSISTAISEEERNAALLLFDYIFSDEGSNIQNYSIPDTWVDDEFFLGPDGTKYPKLNEWIISAADEYKDGDLMGFLLEFMGSRISLGFQKELGAELQATSSSGFKAWDLYTEMNVLTPSYSSINLDLRVMPPFIPLTEEDEKKLKNITIDNTQTKIIFGYIDGTGPMADARELLPVFEEEGLATYLSVHKAAYERMMEDM